MPDQPCRNVGSVKPRNPWRQFRIKVSVMYRNGPDARFDQDYYSDLHTPADHPRLVIGMNAFSCGASKVLEQELVHGWE